MKNFGFIPPIISPTDYFLGSKKLGSVDLNPSGNWKLSLPRFEPQRKREETSACVTFRKYGLVNEEDWPFVEDINEYYKEVPLDLIEKGKKWLERYDFGYEYVKENQIDIALKRSPVSVAVYAWSQNEKSEFIRLGASNHYTLHFLKDDFGRLLVFDSYENPYLKTLAKDHDVEFAQMYVLKKKENPIITEYNEAGFWGKLWQFIRMFLAPKVYD